MTDIIIYGYDVFKDTTRYSRCFGSAAAGGKKSINNSMKYSIIYIAIILYSLSSCRTYYDKESYQDLYYENDFLMKFYKTYNELYYFNPINGSADHEIFYNTHFTMNLPKGITYWMRSGNHFFYEFDSKQIIYIYNPFRNDGTESGEWKLKDVNEGYEDYNLEQYWVNERKYKESHLFKNHKNRITKIYTDGKYQLLLYNIKTENFDMFLNFAKTFKVKE